ncbi:hypothetical protein, partial [Staphylococcus aureus]|uniref:hypothetical protein n=1 Tax=Staphylococcus aureus TaxID=1280 RepID=UPI00123E955E
MSRAIIVATVRYRVVIWRGCPKPSAAATAFGSAGAGDRRRRQRQRAPRPRRIKELGSGHDDA